ncbi:MAG: NlpC/P60 family protein [Armatimonadota bacterium]
MLAQTCVFGKTILVRTEVRTAKIRVSTAKLRKLPTESGRTLGLLDHDASVTVLGAKSGWVLVQTPRGTKGWIRRDLVSLSKSSVVTRKEVKPVSVAGKKVHRPDVKSVAKAPSAQRHLSKPITKISAERVSQPIARVSSDEGNSGVSDGQLPEAVRTFKSPNVSQIVIDDPIAEKRSSVVEFARDVADSNKANNPTRSTLMSRANSQRGTPYRYGTSGGGTFDCSGFTSAMYRKVGVRLPRTAAEQFGVGQHIAKSALTKGDLVFFRNTAGRRGISHVGIYSGNGMFIHASSRGHAVRIDTLSHGYYASHFAGGRRLLR